MKLLVDDLQHAIPYPAALQRWAASLGVDGARELSGLFRQSLFQGTELGPALKEFEADFSEKRVARARETHRRKTATMAVVKIGRGAWRVSVGKDWRVSVGRGSDKQKKKN